MIEVGIMTEYDGEVAEQMGVLLSELSSKWPGGAVDREMIEEIIESPWHDQILAFDGDKLVGMATVSVVMGSKISKNVYLEDFVVSKECRQKGVATLVWERVMDWGRQKGCRRLEFTSSGKDYKEGAVAFYLKRGARIHDTNFFRVEL